MKCWGDNSVGHIGVNSPAKRVTPVDVSGLTSGVAAIAAGTSHTCAITTGGGAKCWGYNGHGGLGDNSTTTRLTPVDVTGLANGVAMLSAGEMHTCAVTRRGEAQCWGHNDTGQVGDGSTADRLLPPPV